MTELDPSLLTTCPYRRAICQVMPRLLALYDADPLSPTYGQGDRYRWAWKLIDFGNGTFQGAAHGLARLLAHCLLPEGLAESAVLRRLDAMFHGAEALRYPNGSMEEAFPFEASFCVTALVAYDLLSAIELLGDRLPEERRRRHLAVVRPMIAFLLRHDEHHAFISNHMATAVVALYKWTALTQEPGEDRGKLFLDRILAAQSAEGWFREYEGADPGYQTLCTYYLADLHRLRPDLGLAEPLARSVRFLWHFAHPDGSFGGLYGSRNTRFYYPAGLEALAAEVPEAAALATFMRRAIATQAVVTLEALDEPNLIPMFNSYCWAAAIAAEGPLPEAPPVPAEAPGTWRREFPQAGLIVDRSPAHYTVISWHKGGVVYHFPQAGPPRIDAGAVARTARGALYSSQAYRPDNALRLEGEALSVTAPMTAMHKQLPTPVQFIVLRLLNTTVMRHAGMGNFVKKLLVRMLITGQSAAPARNRRTIRLGPAIAIEDAWVHGALERLATDRPFSAIHMASQGYWQRQDDAS